MWRPVIRIAGPGAVRYAHSYPIGELVCVTAGTEEHVWDATNTGADWLWGLRPWTSPMAEIVPADAT